MIVIANRKVVHMRIPEAIDGDVLVETLPSPGSWLAGVHTSSRSNQTGRGEREDPDVGPQIEYCVAW